MIQMMNFRVTRRTGTNVLRIAMKYVVKCSKHLLRLD